MNILKSAHHIVFVGGFTDRRPWNKVVYNHFLTYKEQMPHKSVVYFQWFQKAAIINWLQHNPHASLVGHSYGADTAACVVADGVHVSSLITIDPVSRFPPKFEKVAMHCDYWANYLAIGLHPGLRSRHVNLVAKLGGHWMHKPEPWADLHDVNQQEDHMTICRAVLTLDAEA